MTLNLLAVVVGKYNLVIPVEAEPNDTIASMLDSAAKVLARIKKPNEFTAYSAIQGGKWTLTDPSPDYAALGRRDPVVMARYMTLESRLDPAKRVVDYFGYGVPEERGHILLDWTPASWEKYEAEQAKVAQIHEKQLENALAAKLMRTQPVMSVMDSATVFGEYPACSGVVRPWDCVLACLPPRVWSWRFSTTSSDGMKKTN